MFPSCQILCRSFHNHLVSVDDFLGWHDVPQGNFFYIYMINRYDNNWIDILFKIQYLWKSCMWKKVGIGILPCLSCRYISLQFLLLKVTCDGVVHQCAIEALLVFAFSLYLLVGLDSTTIGQICFQILLTKSGRQIS